jgi:hypothetical protein
MRLIGSSIARDLRGRARSLVRTSRCIFVSTCSAKQVFAGNPHGLCELLLGKELIALGFQCVSHGGVYVEFCVKIWGESYLVGSVQAGEVSAEILWSLS